MAPTETAQPEEVATPEATEEAKKRDATLNTAVQQAVSGVKTWVGIVTSKDAVAAMKVTAKAIATMRGQFEVTVKNATYRGKAIGDAVVPAWSGKGSQYLDWYRANFAPELERLIPDRNMRITFTGALAKHVQDAVKDLATPRDLDILGMTPKKQKEQQEEAANVDSLLAAVPGAKGHRNTVRRVLREQDGDIGKATEELRKEYGSTPGADGQTEVQTPNVVTAFRELAADRKKQTQVLVQSCEALRDGLREDEPNGIPGSDDIADLLEQAHRMITEARAVVAPQQGRKKTGVKVEATA